jgi:hypothetical protein
MAMHLLMGMHPKGVAKSTSDPWGACIMTAELNCGAEGIGVGLGALELVRPVRLPEELRCPKQ